MIFKHCFLEKDFFKECTHKSGLNWIFVSIVSHCQIWSVCKTTNLQNDVQNTSSFCLALLKSKPKNSSLSKSSLKCRKVGRPPRESEKGAARCGRRARVGVQSILLFRHFLLISWTLVCTYSIELYNSVTVTFCSFFSL